MSMKQKQTQNTLESRRIRCLCMIGDKKAMPKWLQTHGSSGKSYKALDTSLHQNALLGPKNWTVWNQLNARRANIEKMFAIFAWSAIQWQWFERTSRSVNKFQCFDGHTIRLFTSSFIGTQQTKVNPDSGTFWPLSSLSKNPWTWDLHPLL